MSRTLPRGEDSLYATSATGGRRYWTGGRRDIPWGVTAHSPSATEGRRYFGRGPRRAVLLFRLPANNHVAAPRRFLTGAVRIGRAGRLARPSDAPRERRRGALAGESAWTHPKCAGSHGDSNGDGKVTFADIKPFVARSGTTCP